MATPWQLPTDREPLEHDEQKDLVRWFRRSFPGVLIFAVPNGGKRGKREAMKLQAEGVVAGIPDLCIPEWGPLWIEMKRQKTGRVSKVQKEIHQELNGIGQTVLVCKGSAVAQSMILEFLALEYPDYPHPVPVEIPQ